LLGCRSGRRWSVDLLLRSGVHLELLLICSGVARRVLEGDLAVGQRAFEQRPSHRARAEQAECKCGDKDEEIPMDPMRWTRTCDAQDHPPRKLRALNIAANAGEREPARRKR